MNSEQSNSGLDSKTAAQLADITRRLRHAVQSVSAQVTRSEGQLNYVKLGQKFLQLGRFAPLAITVGSTLLGIARLRPVLSVLAVGIGGYFVDRALNPVAAKGETADSGNAPAMAEPTSPAMH